MSSVEFADVATATACYRSDEYQKAKAIRQANADADFIIIEGAYAESLDAHRLLSGTGQTISRARKSAIAFAS